MKKNFIFLAILFVAGCAHGPCEKDVVFQNAPINSLMAGCYTGTMTVGELKEHGDFGLGTLDALDGEMIALGGAFYQIKPDGKAYALEHDATSPFATLVFFEAGQKFSFEQSLDYKELTRSLDEKLPSPNLFYAVKIEGKFSSLKVRSAARQEKLYRALPEAIKEQKVFELDSQEGTLVGFRFPPFTEGANVPGYHFHFLSRDRAMGGHVLDFRIEGARIEVDEAKGLLLETPRKDEFLKYHSGVDSREDLAKVEK